MCTQTNWKCLRFTYGLGVCIGWKTSTNCDFFTHIVWWSVCSLVFFYAVSFFRISLNFWSIKINRTSIQSNSTEDHRKIHGRNESKRARRKISHHHQYQASSDAAAMAKCVLCVWEPHSTTSIIFISTHSFESNCIKWRMFIINITKYVLEFSLTNLNEWSQCHGYCNVLKNLFSFWICYSLLLEKLFIFLLEHKRIYSFQFLVSFRI